MPHVHNALHNFTRLQSAWKALLGEEDATFTGIERAGETLTPVHDLWTRPEDAALRGEILFSHSSAIVGVALEMAFAGIRNPAGSGVLVVVPGSESQVTPNTAGRMIVTHGVIAATDVDGSEQVTPLDTRFNLTGVSSIVGIHGTGLAAVGNDTLIRFRAGAAGTQPQTRLPTTLILSPGFEFRVYNPTVNDNLEAWFGGYIRPAFDEELAPA